MGVDGGVIEPGQPADLVVVEGDPLSFEGLRSRIVAVVQCGEPVAGDLVH